MITCVWVIGPAYNALHLFPTTALGSDGICLRVAVWPNQAAKSIAGLVTFFLEYALPLAIMIYCYIRMAVSIQMKIIPLDTRAQNNPVQIGITDQRRSQNMAKAKRNILKTLVTVSACFAICWTWNQVHFMLFNLGLDVNLSATLFHTSITLAFLNTCINPIIYTAQYKQFQVAVKLMFCRGMATRKGNNGINTTTTSTI